MKSLSDPLPRCPYCYNLPFRVVVRPFQTIIHESIWSSCRCSDFAEEMEEVRNQYLRDTDGG